MHSFFSFKARAFGPPLTFASARSFSRSSIIISPPSLGSRLAFEWMHGRWVVADPTDICKSSDFLHVLDMADKLATRLNNFSTDLDRRSRAHCDRTPLISWFALRRSAPSSSTHGDTRRFSLGASTHWERRHKEIRIIGRIYSHDNSTLPGFLNFYLGTARHAKYVPTEPRRAGGLLFEGVPVHHAVVYQRAEGRGCFVESPRHLTQ